MNEERESMYEDNEQREALQRYEQMIKDGKYVFFDEQQFESIIDYYLDLNQQNLALTANNIALSRYPESSVLQIKKAQIILNTGNPTEALKILNRIGIPDSQSAEVYLLKGSSYAEMGKRKEAIRFFNEALQRTYEDKAEVLHQIAYSLERQNDYRTALKYLDEAIQLEPKNSAILYEIAWCYDRLEEDEKAILYYQKYLDIDPFAEHVWYNLGMVFCRADKYEKAIEAFEFAIAIDERYASAYFNKGNAWLSLTAYDKAIEAFNEFLYLDENNPDAMISLGECYEQLKDYKKAIEYYKKVTELEPAYSDAWFGMGVCLYFMEYYFSSLQHIAKAIEIHDEEGEYWFSMGNVLLKLEEFDNAAQAFSRATELDPYDVESWLNLSEISFLSGDPGAAIDILNNALVFLTDNGLIHYRMGAYYYNMSEPATAIYHFERGLALNFPAYPETFEFCPQAQEDSSFMNLIHQYKKQNNIL